MLEQARFWEKYCSGKTMALPEVQKESKIYNRVAIAAPD